MCAAKYHKRLGIISIYFLSFTAYACVSVIAPLFPSEAAKKGMSASVSGSVFSAYSFTLLLMNAVTGKILPLLGTKPALSVGIIIVAICNIIFGSLINIDNYATFSILCFVVRIIEGIGAALINTTGYLLLIKISDDNLSKSISINEACSSIGFSVGPPLGSFFYSVGGYILPFIILGTTLLLNVPLTLLCLENYKDFTSEEKESNEEKLNYFKLISIPKVTIICFTVITVGINLGIHTSTLQLYLKTYNIEPESVGFMFMLLSGTFTVLSLTLSQYFSQLNAFKCFFFGILLSGLGFLVISPSSLILFNNNITVIGFSLVVIAMGCGFSLLPSLPAILNLTLASGYSDNITNNSYISGFWTASYSLGLTFGALFGPALFQYFGSEVMFTTTAILNFLIASLSLTSICAPFDKFYKRQVLNYVEFE